MACSTEEVRVQTSVTRVTGRGCGYGPDIAYMGCCSPARAAGRPITRPAARSTTESRGRPGGETLFAGIAVPYVAAVLLICLGLVVGGTAGMAIAYGSLLLLVVGVFRGILAFITTDDDEH